MLRVNQLIGFGGKTLGAIGITDDGDFDADASTTSTTRTWTSLSSTGPKTIVAVTWRQNNTNGDLVSGTWNGDAVTVIAQFDQPEFTTPQTNYIAFIGIDGARSGDLVLTFANGVQGARATVLSLTNLQSYTYVDTDVSGSIGTAASRSLTALASAGAGGIRIAATAATSTTVSITWTGATEVSDDAGSQHRHSVAYALGAGAGTITETPSSSAFGLIAGVSLR